MSWPHHRAQPSRRRRRPPPPASKPPPRARPRSALSLRWRPPPGPWRSTSRSWSSTRPQTSNSKVGRERAAARVGAGGRRDLGWVGGSREGRRRAASERPLPHAPALSILRRRPAPALGLPAPRPARSLPPSPARGSMRAPAGARRRGPALAPPPRPPSCGPAGAPPGCCPRCYPHLALVLGPRGPSGVVWEGVGGR